MERKRPLPMVRDRFSSTSPGPASPSAAPREFAVSVPPDAGVCGSRYRVILFIFSLGALAWFLEYMMGYPTLNPTGTLVPGSGVVSSGTFPHVAGGGASGQRFLKRGGPPVASKVVDSITLGSDVAASTMEFLEAEAMKKVETGKLAELTAEKRHQESEEAAKKRKQYDDQEKERQDARKKEEEVARKSAEEKAREEERQKEEERKKKAEEALRAKGGVVEKEEKEKRVEKEEKEEAPKKAEVEEGKKAAPEENKEPPKEAEEPKEDTKESRVKVAGKEVEEIEIDPDIDMGPSVVEKVLKSKCFDLKGVDANGAENAYSFCPYKRVEQYILNPRLTFKLGTFDGWLPSDSAEDKYSAQFYGGGDACSPTVVRTTTVVFHCDPSADVPEVTEAREVEMCNYELDLKLKEWCDVEKAGMAVKYQREPVPPVAPTESK